MTYALAFAVLLFGGSLFASRPDPLRAFLDATLLLAVAMLPWSGVQIGGVPIGDLPLIVALLTLAFVARGRLAIPPPFVLVGALLIAAAGLWTYLAPPTQSYLSSRFIDVSAGAIVRSTANLPNLAKYELAVLVLPVIIAIVADGRRSYLRRIIAAWLLGISVSCLIAYTDYLGLTHVSSSLLGYTSISTRQPGLTSQPNNIGVQAAMAVPICVAAFRSRARTTRFAATAVLLICGAGIFVSGSRGSAVGSGIAVVLLLCFAPETRRWSGRIVTALVAVGAYLIGTTGGSKILSTLRLTAGTQSQAIDESDSARSGLRAQGLTDFGHSPLHGIGWGFANQAHVIYIQLLAAGGILGLVGFLVVTIGSIAVGTRLQARTETFVGALLASVTVWLVIGLVENQLADQWIYVPLSCLAAEVVRRRWWATDDRGTHRERVPSAQLA